MLYRIAIFSKYHDTSIYRYVSHITNKLQTDSHKCSLAERHCCALCQVLCAHDINMA